MAGRPLRVFALSCALTLPLLAKDPEIPSTWRSGDVVVDGVADEWAGALVPLPGAPLSIGVKNDATFLYICVRTSDEDAKKKILGLGLSVFVDASGKEDRAFGIRFPAGPRGEGSDLPDAGDAAFNRRLDLAVAGGELRVLGAHESDGARMKVSEAKPILAALGEADGALVIELRIPLAFGVDAPHAIETEPGRTVALGFETTPPRESKPRGGGSGFSLGGGGHGGHGGRGGHGGHGGGSEGPSKSDAKGYGKPIKAWLAVPLATKTAA